MPRSQISAQDTQVGARMLQASSQAMRRESRRLERMEEHIARLQGAGRLGEAQLLQLEYERELELFNANLRQHLQLRATQMGMGNSYAPMGMGNRSAPSTSIPRGQIKQVPLASVFMSTMVAPRRSARAPSKPHKPRKPSKPRQTKVAIGRRVSPPPRSPPKTVGTKTGGP